MHHHFRNHQLYLAEKLNWQDNQVAKTSKRSLMKIESLKMIATSGEQDEQLRLVEKLVRDSLLNTITPKKLLQKEGFRLYNLCN